MFVDLMADVYHTFAERFLKVQVVFEPPPGSGQPPHAPAPPPKRAFDPFAMKTGRGAEVPGAVDIGPGEPGAPPVARPEPKVIGAGRRSSLDGAGGAPQDWSNVGRNDPCPCGSGKKFKKCHGTAV